MILTSTDETPCTLENALGSSVRVSNYGAAITAVRVPDRNGRFADVVLGFDSLDDYRSHGWYCGAMIGRYAGRIRDARFELDGHRYDLAANQGRHQLHGGPLGFDKVFWDVHPSRDAQTVRLHHISPDGDQGYPGTLDTAIAYTLTDENELIIDVAATTNRATPINFTHHGYFNLAGHGDVLGHELMIAADEYAPIDQDLIPTGELLPVTGTSFDFRQSAAIGSRLPAEGYDHDYRLRDVAPEQPGPRFAARLSDPASGRVLEVFTTEPVLHFYGGRFIPAEPAGKGGQTYGAYSGVALETQHFSDSPNQPHFPSTILRPGELYRSRTVFRFSAAAHG